MQNRSSNIEDRRTRQRGSPDPLLLMQNRITKVEDRRGGEPQRIGDVLVELLAQYEDRFPAARTAALETPTVTEDQSCSFCRAELASVS